jgi:hypothetical protein
MCYIFEVDNDDPGKTIDISGGPKLLLEAADVKGGAHFSVT